ncbi:MAG: phosphomannomutase [Vampirovibrio sp.]|nr:phosphomannomutase [Vampirovibrio sp.]
MTRTFWGRDDIRAIVDDSFGTSEYYKIGLSYARYIRQHLSLNEQDAHWVSVGYDARLHSPRLESALVQGLADSGLNVIRLGMTTSPLVYFADYLHTLNPAFPPLIGSLMVTASHNPPEYNGVKFTCRGGAMPAGALKVMAELYRELPPEPETTAPSGVIETRSIVPDYLAWMEGHFGAIGQGLKVVVDSGNATAGLVAPELLRRLGCEVVELFSEPDGSFPNHHPDPCVPRNLRFLTAAVQQHQADIGFAFDGDSDRVGIVDEQGRILPGDHTMLFLAEALLRERPGGKVLFDIKCTQSLFRFVRERSGVPMMAPSGHAVIKSMMKAQDIPLGGELSGHIFFRDRHWGFDDALYAACRILESMAQRKAQAAGYRLSCFSDELPVTLVSEEFRIHCSRAEGERLIQQLMAELADNPACFGPIAEDVLTLDGIRINFTQGFFLLRLSNTEPCITVRFEAGNESDYQQIERKLSQLTQRLTCVA